MYTPTDETDLIDGLIAGQEPAFRKLYDKYHSKIYRSALKFVKSEELAKEVVQEVFARIWENRQSINRELSFGAFVFKIAHNHIFNLLKRAAKENSIKKEILAAAELADNRTENTVIAAEYEQIANNAIAQLPPQRRLIFTMCRQEGKSYEEAALLLGISKSTVKDHMTKAHKSIKDYVYIHNGVCLAIICLLSVLPFLY